MSAVLYGAPPPHDVFRPVPYMEPVGVVTYPVGVVNPMLMVANAATAPTELDRVAHRLVAVRINAAMGLSEAGRAEVDAIVGALMALAATLREGSGT